MGDFDGAGKTAGLELWRIEALAPVKMPAVTGKFHTGDSYILLNTISTNGRISWNIHFWLGAESSQDECGVAAYKTVELDDSLGGGPIQYREVQGNESDMFMAIFKSMGGIEYLPGGVDSGFTHVERDVWPLRLLHCKGRRVVRTQEVPPVVASLNQGDVFILDQGLVLTMFCGPTANGAEKRKAFQVISRINDEERGARAEVVVMDEDDLCGEQYASFWNALGGRVDMSQIAEGTPDEDPAPSAEHSVLVKVSDATEDGADGGEMKYVDVTPEDHKLLRTMLDSDDVFILRPKVADRLYTWIGRGSTLAEKKAATSAATGYLEKFGLPANTRIERISEGHENSSFKQEFFVWKMNAPAAVEAAAPLTTSELVNAEQLLHAKEMEEKPLDDNGSGSIQIWRMEDFKKEEVAEESYGQFFGGDSYIIVYNYRNSRNIESTIIYFWLGRSSSTDEKATAALLTKDLDDNVYQGRAVQIRVVQGKEPAHFRQLFSGRMIIHQGGRPSGFKNVTEYCATETAEHLYHIKGTTALNTCGVEVACTCPSLNSADSFVLTNDQTAFVWYGSLATEDEHAVALNVANILGGNKAVVEMKEGSEGEDFWNALGGQTEYTKEVPGNELQQVAQEARLFHASTATGRFRVEEMYNFDQTDLMDEDVMLLDTSSALFVWLGSGCSEEEKARSFEFAANYLATCANSDNRSQDVPIIGMHAGNEPTMFSAHFVGWDPEYAQKQIFNDPYAAKLAANAAEKDARLGRNEGTSDLPVPPTSGNSPNKAARPVSVVKPMKPQGGDYLSMRNTENRNTTTASSHSSPFAYVSGAAGGGGGGPAAASSTHYLGTRKTEPEVKAAHASPFAFVSGGSGSATGPVSKTASSTHYLGTRKTEPEVKAAHSSPFAFVSGAGGAGGAPAAAPEAERTPITEFFSYEELSCGDVSKLPAGVEPSRKEEYLFDEDFEARFECDKATFLKQPKWKRDKAKKEWLLF